MLETAPTTSDTTSPAALDIEAFGKEEVSLHYNIYRAVVSSPRHVRNGRRLPRIDWRVP